ncbi:MAG: prepilin-type N-terminal cleavage/methylation domain-containing protein [Clostridia bacterium]|nr:prepilin-type N-terminal cleavage/methylation domain-containing protein [Clostridia bacterium]
MQRKTNKLNLQKNREIKRGKRGFTLVELAVVLGLLVMLVSMVVSFSVLIKDFVNASEDEYTFLEEHAVLKDRFCLWASENDTPDAVFTVGADHTLTLSKNGAVKTVTVSDGVLSLGDVQVPDLETVDGVSFYSNGKLIKCTAVRCDEDGAVVEELSFVFFPRSAALVQGG